MAYEREIATRFYSTGAEKLINDHKRVAATMGSSGRAIARHATQAKEWLQRNKTVLLAMAAAAGAALWGILKQSPLVNASITSMRIAFSLLAMEIGDRVSPVIDAATDFVWRLYDAWEGLNPVMKDVISYVILIGGVFAVAVGAVAGLVMILAPLGIVGAIAVGVLGVLFYAVGAVVAIFDIWKNGLNWINALMVIFASIVLLPLAPFIILTAAVAAIEHETGIFGDTLTWLGDTFKAIGGWISDTATQIWDAISGAWNKIAEITPIVVSDVMTALQPLIDALVHFGDVVIMPFVEPWLWAGDQLVGLITHLGTELWNGLKQIGEGFADLGGWIKDGLTLAAEKVKEGIIWIFDWITDKIGGLAKLAYQWGIDLLTFFAQGLADGVNKVSGAVEGAGNAVKDFLGLDRDNPVNDRMTVKWGEDLMKYWSMGVERGVRKFPIPDLSSHAASAPMAAGAFGGGGSSTTSVSIGTIVLQGDSSSMAAGSRLGRSTGDNILERLRRR